MGFADYIWQKQSGTAPPLRRVTSEAGTHHLNLHRTVECSLVVALHLARRRWDFLLKKMTRFHRGKKNFANIKAKKLWML